MKITDVKAYLTAPHGAPFLFVEVHTDEGVTGVGEASLYQANSLLFRGVDAIRPLVVGLDPANIEEIWQRIFRRFLRIGPRGVVTCLISAVDIALWDIKGKALGVPVYQLLGGPVQGPRAALHPRAGRRLRHLPGRQCGRRPGRPGPTATTP